MPVNGRHGEEGFTMIMTVIGLSLIAMLGVVALTAVQGDAHLTSRDLARKQAYEAAKAGISEYAYLLHANTGYWAECDKETGVPHAINQKGSTARSRAVPGNPNVRYAIELIPANGQTQCDPQSLTTATATMIEALEPMKGTFRIRSNGFAGDTRVAITATFKPASFLDYVYFTQLETSDPVTYGTEELIEAAGRQCTKTIRDGRYTAKLTNKLGKVITGSGYSSGKYCDTISFVGGDNIKGPMHTNDAFVICESPVLGRGPSDPVEVSSPPTGWYASYDDSLNNNSSCRSSTPNFKGTFQTKSPVLVPPVTNAELSTIAEPAFRFKGEVSICLEGSIISIAKGTSCAGGYSGPMPSNGVIYVESETCSGEYSPFDVTYAATSGTCGNVNVSGTYSSPLTIAASNDILIKGNLTKTNETAMLGLIANNFIRVYHPVTLVHPKECDWVYQGGRWVEVCEEDTTEWDCLGNTSGVLKNIQIEAALLAINHSIIVDNYNCGASLGNLNVKGALAQNFRGAVGTGGGGSNTGYLKNYEYDERLKTTEPPSFIAPLKADWVIGRETTE
jgi:type II secretory pathway pseudopilin PulG